MTRPRALDLFCGAGGAAMGLHRAGFDVVGVDIEPQPRYPFTFVQGDALDADVRGFDFIWASPPCQAHSITARCHPQLVYPDMIPATRAKLRAAGVPFVIENVQGAPLIVALKLCGAMFGLPLYRWRWFESNLLLLGPDRPDLPRGATLRGEWPCIAGNGCFKGQREMSRKSAWVAALGIDWMLKRELAQAIPPAYSAFIGRQVLA